MQRRRFVKRAGLGLAAAALPLPAWTSPMEEPSLSLAQWSLHRALFEGSLKAVDFPRVAVETFEIRAVEYVNQFYTDHLGSTTFWRELKARTDALGVTNLLIMIDDAGLLGDPAKTARHNAVEAHLRWADAAAQLGCHSIRVNAFGPGPREALRGALTDGLGQLTEKAAALGVNVLIENHGFHTSDGAFITGIIREVGHPGLGTLPDFGNWCLNAEWGSTMGGNCSENYGPEKGLADFLPFAGGVSAKSYDFDASGNETLLPYRNLLQQVKDSGFTGHIGIEYEGSRLGEPEGIRATKDLILRLWPELD
ncbi:sugar phosphate isomerase/epimerase family protein [Robiginitalea sediminis]|uniref:sugar phosphate isomerase/epimerase family protein n=1 Tax=Robiginitalea sediminis TaxID=1982593 RepID=UPI000B4B261D|nr:TIM barrel protein [Robiginitalea sediminis]